MKHLMYLLFMVFLPMVANADSVEIDGINYNLVSKTKEAEVIRPGSDRYSGVIIIPDSVNYDGKTYHVTKIGKSAFRYSFIESVSIPKSITAIEEEAFGYCEHLKSVHISDIAAWCKISFADYYSNPLQYAHHLFLAENEIRDSTFAS